MNLPDVSHKNVLFVGERIKDVYHYGKLLCRPPKEPIICTQRTSTEFFDGGVIAAANHVRGLVKSIDIVSSCEQTKERYVDSSRNRKLFEEYTAWREIPAIWPNMTAYDSVIVTDYGHGMMTEGVVSALCEQAAFLAVNVQTNASNYGFNLATKYPRVDYLCVDEAEARLATLNQFGPIEDSLTELSLMATRVVVTLGKEGAIGFDGKVHRSAAFHEQVLDTMGAGDAFFAVTACMAEELEMPELLRVGNAAGKIKAMTLGHRQSVTKDAIGRFLTSH